MIKIWYLLKKGNHRPFPHSHRLFGICLFFFSVFCLFVCFFYLWGFWQFALPLTSNSYCFLSAVWPANRKAFLSSFAFLFWYANISWWKLSCVLFYYTFRPLWLCTVRILFFWSGNCFFFPLAHAWTLMTLSWNLFCLFTYLLCFLCISKENCLFPYYESGRYSEVVLCFCFVLLIFQFMQCLVYKHLKNRSPGKHGIPDLLMIPCSLC